MGDRLAKLPRRLGEAPGLGQCHPRLVMRLRAVRVCRQDRLQQRDRRLAVAMLTQEAGQAIAQSRIVRHQCQARAILWLDE